MKLNLSDLTKRCGEKEALSHFSYTFENGIYGILGANGAARAPKNLF
jgi:ABC-type multidrug transport system ATPase subunit